MPKSENGKPATGTTVQGTFLSIVVMPWPWPPKQRLIIHRARLQDRTVTISAEPDGTIKLSLKGVANSEFSSCPIIVPFEYAATTIGASWILPIFNMIVGTEIVCSTERPDIVPKMFEISGVLPNDIEDFSKENQKAIERRASTLGGTHPTPRRRRRTKDEMFEALRNEGRQISDLLDHIDRGEIHHLPGLASRLRLLIAEGNPMPLLQTCAAFVDRPLTVYAPPIGKFDQRKVDDPSLLSVAMAISATPIGVARNAADLDVWLETLAARIDGRASSQREVIKQIGNTIGSHVDLDAHPTIDALKNMNSGIEGAEFEMLLFYLRSLAKVSKNLIENVLA